MLVICGRPESRKGERTPRAQNAKVSPSAALESLVLGALSSSPVHRAFVLVLGTNIAVLLDCSKSSRQCSLSYLLTYQ